jgi:hypothetical protein
MTKQSQAVTASSEPIATSFPVAIPADWIWIQRAFLGLHAVLLRTDRAWPLGDLAREALSVPAAAE